MGAGLIGQNVGDDAAADEFGEDIGAVADEADGDGFRSGEEGESLVEGVSDAIAVAAIEAALDAGGIDIDAEEARTVHGGGEGLGAAHAAHAAGDDEFAGEGSTEVLFGERGKGFVSALHDALAADVDPGASGHLTVHSEAEFFEAIEFVPVGPVADEVGIG